MIVETKSGRMATKMKTVVTTNEIKRTEPEVESSAKRRSGRTKQPSNKKIESIPSPSSRALTNGTPRTTKSTANHAGSTTNTKLALEFTKKSSNFSPDVVSDLEEILGSPIKTHEIRKQTKTDTPNAIKNSTRVNNKPQNDDDVKPATRSSKRISNRVVSQPVATSATAVGAAATATIDAKEKQTSSKPTTNTRNSAKKTSDHATFNHGILSEESQGSQSNDAYNNLQIEPTSDNIVMNIKQEKEVSYTMTDDINVFTCEMCSEVFSDRAQLLVHVPVHI